KWAQRGVGTGMRVAVDRAAVEAAVEHHHFSVHPVEGPQSEAAMAEQLGDGGIAVVTARQQAGDGRNLVDLGGVRGQHTGGEDGERRARQIIGRIILTPYEGGCARSGAIAEICTSSSSSFAVSGWLRYLHLTASGIS